MPAADDPRGYLRPAEEVGRILSFRSVQAELLTAVGAARSREKDRRDAGVLLLAIYGRGTMAEGFPLERPWTKEIAVRRSVLAEVSGLPESRVAWLVEKILSTHELCAYTRRGDDRYTISERLFEPLQTADLLDWGEVLSRLAGRTITIQIFWDLVVNRLSPPASELQSVALSEIVNALGYRKNTVSDHIRAIEDAGLLQVARGVPGVALKYALTPLALSRKQPRIRGLSVSDLATDESSAPTPAEPATTPASRLEEPSLQRVVIQGIEMEAPAGSVIELEDGGRRFVVRLPDR